MSTDCLRSSPVRVLLVEDDPDVAKDLALLLEGRSDLALASAFGAAEPALAAIQRGLDADVALVDLRLPRMSGEELIRKLKVARADLEIVVLTVFEDDESLYGALRAGASGYLLKDAPRSELAGAILQVHRGGAPMSPSIARRVLLEFRQPPQAKAFALTAREREVLDLLTKGASYPLIGKALAISISTVQSHIRAIYRKLEVCTKAEATAEAYKRGIVR
ncbi:MAG: Two-component response regulator [Labilithrix sp.]|nr:Two-component response regulator [Labilithrix sp.]